MRVRASRRSRGDATVARRMDAVVREPHALEPTREDRREDAGRRVARHPLQPVQLRASRWPVAVRRQGRQQPPRPSSWRGAREIPLFSTSSTVRWNFPASSTAVLGTAHVQDVFKRGTFVLLDRQGRWGDRQGAIHRFLEVRLSTRPMRFRAVVVLAAMPLVLGAWTLSSESSDGTPKIDHKPWNPKGKAVVKTPNGVSHVIRKSRCYPSILGAPRTGRLQFGGTPIDSDFPAVHVHRHEKAQRNLAVLDIIDGVLRLAPNATIAVLGKAQVQDDFARRGTFVLYQNKGGGVTGKARYTGSWICANMPWNPRGKAVVKTPDGCRTSSAAVFAASGQTVMSGCGLAAKKLAGLSATTDMPYMHLVANRREGNLAVLDIIDGVLKFPPEWGDANHFGSNPRPSRPQTRHVCSL